MTVPKGWTISRLGDLFDITSSKRVFQSEWQREGVPFYRAREIIKLIEHGHVENDLFITESMFSDYSSRYGVPQEGDLMVTGVGTIGRCYRVKTGDRFYFKDGNIIWLKRKTETESAFVEYAFQTDQLRKQIDNAGGTTVGTYTIVRAKRTLVYLPPLPEQKKIASILSSVDETIQATRETIEQTKKVKKGLMQELLTRGIGHTKFKETEIGEIPESWALFRLEDVSHRVSYGFTNPMPTTDSGPWMITAKDITDGRINYSTARHTSQHAFNEFLSDKSRSRMGDVLITKDGTLGRVAIVDRESICINQSVAFIRPDRDKIGSEFLCILLASPRMQTRLMQDSGGSTIKHLYISKMASMQLPLPPSTEQEKITEIVLSVDNLLQYETNHLQKLKMLKMGLMQDLLTGKVRVAV